MVASSRPTPAPSGVGAVPVRNTIELLDLLRRQLKTPSRQEIERIMMVAVPAAIGSGVLVAIADGPIGMAPLALAVLAVVCWRVPHFAVYAIVAGAPWIVGFGRNQVIPTLRLNEALLAMLLLVLGLRWLVCSRRVVIGLRGFDWAVLGLVLAGFALALLSQLVRSRPLSSEDIFYAAVFVRLGLLYALVRITIRTPGQVRTVLGLSLLSASLLGLLGTADSLNLADTAQRLNRFFPNAAVQVDDGRGAATIGNPIGFGVYQGIHAMIGLALWLIGERPRGLVAVAAGICCIGVVGSGQIGPMLSFAVGALALAVVTRSFWKLVRFGLPLLVIVGLVGSPLLARRLDGFSGPAIDSRKRESIANSTPDVQGQLLFDANPGSSWDVRLFNLERYFIPQLSEFENVIWGVTPQARVPSPREGEEFIWIESGHLWLLWSGGVWLFVAWFVMLGVGMVHTRRVLRTRAGPVAATAAAAFASLWIMNVAQTFDPHITLRGSADIFYPLMALTLVAPSLVAVVRPTPHRSRPSGDDDRDPGLAEPDRRSA